MCIRDVLCRLALWFQRMKNIRDWYPHEGENLVFFDAENLKLGEILGGSQKFFVSLI